MSLTIDMVPLIIIDWGVGVRLNPGRIITDQSDSTQATVLTTLCLNHSSAAATSPK